MLTHFYRAHHSKIVTTWAAANNVILAFQPAYSSNLNSQEVVWALIKGAVRRDMLDCVKHNVKFIDLLMEHCDDFNKRTDLRRIFFASSRAMALSLEGNLV